MKTKMTHKERFMKAVNHQEADRVPLCMDAEGEVWPRLAKALHVNTKEECYKALEIDEWMLDPHVTDPRRKTISADESVSQWGYHVCRKETAFGSYNDICKPPIKGEDLTLEEIDNHDWPDYNMIDFDHYEKKMIEMGDRAFISHITHGPYFNCTFIRGMENFLMDIATNPELAKRMMDRAEVYIQGAIDNLLKNARPLPDVYYIADDFCSSDGPLFSPIVWREWVKPYLTRIGEKIHAKGVKFMIHVCGSVRPYIPDLIEAGVDILEPVQTSAVGMSLEGLKKDFGKDITFYGSIDTHHVLPKGTTQEVSDAVKHTIDVMAPGGGFILGPAHTYIQPDTPIENIITMYRVAAEYGKY